MNYPTQSLNLLSDVAVDDGYIDEFTGVDMIEKLALSAEFYFFEPFIQSDLATYSQIDDGICGATTAMNVLKYYCDAKSLVEDVYYDYMKVYNILRTYQTLDDPKNDNPYNIANQSKRKKALTTYIKNHTSYKISATSYLWNSWTFIYNDINNGKVVDYRYGNDDYGHCVLAVGAMSFESGAKFIYVADTWNKNLRWLNYGYHSNIFCMSIKIYE